MSSPSAHDVSILGQGVGWVGDMGVGGGGKGRNQHSLPPNQWPQLVEEGPHRLSRALAEVHT